MALSEIIINRIREQGPLSFHDYMEICLYHPDWGYYNSPREKIGESGDFFTSPKVSPIFGALIARQIEEMWVALDKEPFTLVEYGAGQGELCREILQALKKNDLLYRHFRYCIIEQSASMRDREKQIQSEKLSWYSRIGDIPNLNGCILSNELIDNFPVHQVLMQDELMEVFVDYNQGFSEVLKPAGPELKNYFAGLGVSLPAGFRTEVNLKALGWLRDVGSALNKGFVITIDYGHPSAVLYNEKRSRGTLTCFHRHTMHDDPYLHVGDQDITTHINFSALAHWGPSHGLRCLGFTQQARFLQGLGFAAELKKWEMENRAGQPNDMDRRLHALLLDMGNRIKVLVQQKGDARAMLSGLQFAQPWV